MKSKNEQYLEYLDFIRKNSDFTVCNKLEQIASKKPDYTAFIYQDRQVSYEEFNQMANQFAWFFNSQDIKRGDVVAILMHNSPYYLAAVMGLSKLGAIAALINTEIREEKLAEDINLSEARMLIVQEELRDIFENAKDFVRMRYPGKVLFYPEIISELPSKVENPGIQVRNFEPFVYLYTAGHTGGRKVVPLTHYRWLLTAETVRIYAELTPEDRGYTCIPFWLNSGFSGVFAAMLASEGTLVLAPRFSARTFWDDVSRHNASYFLGTGQMFKYIYMAEPGDNDKRHGVKKVLSNGMPGEIFLPFKERFNIEKIVEIYGTTENVAILVNIDEIPGMCGCLSLGGLRQGEVVKYNEEKDEMVTDNDGFAIRCKSNETGLLLLKVDEYTGFEGYLNNFEESELRLERNVFEPKDRYFNTRDLVKLHENDYIEFVRRLDDVYRWRGKTVSAQMVADIVRKFFGPIEDACVIGVPVKGYEGRASLAVLKLIEDEKMDWRKFTDYLHRHLPRYEVPIFIRLTRSKKLKENKERYIEEGFNPSKVKEELFVYDADKKAYISLTPEIYEDIISHKFWI